ncbi:hypothetical protein [Absidia glauca]|uniref:Uncharacterized protein n=1 Tax=Absidia glauca TaxID=4829 RepID=A0A168R7I5_ABSGL|nr:hypothetical protein [Absidia glauca]
MQPSSHSLSPMQSQSQDGQVLVSSLVDPEPDSTSKSELIQKATVRLRCRLLEEGLCGAQSKVSYLQSELDDLRIELSTTENVLSKFGAPDDRQLQALERRFNTHQHQLDRLLSTNHISTMVPIVSPPPSKPSLPANAVTTSTSFSSTLSRMSSIFSTSQQKPFKNPSGIATDHQHRRSPPSSASSASSSNYTATTSEDEDNDSLASPSIQEARDKQSRRRRRVKQLRQEYQQRLRVYDPTWNVNGADTPSPSSVDTSSINSIKKKQQSPPQQKGQQPPSTATKPTIASARKRSSAKQPTLSTAPARRSPMPSSQSKPAPAQCLCKRHTNKQDPSKGHKGAPSTSRTYCNKQPESVLLETPKHPLSPIADETTRTTSPLVQHADSPSPGAAPDSKPTIEPPSQSHVSEWLLQQRHYLLTHQQQDEDGYNEMDTLDSHNISDHPSPSLKARRSPPPPLALGSTKRQQGQDHSSSGPFHDILRYLDTFSDFSYDATLQQDLTDLLSPNHPPPTYPVALSDSSRAGQRPSSFYHQTRVCRLLASCGMVGGSRYLLNGVNKGLSWFKFLGVLSLALLISLGRGPDHMLLSLDDMDYLDLMADQGEPAYTYYL